jgi:hypothetical protein
VKAIGKIKVIRGFVIAAPISLKNQPHIAVAVVRKDLNTQRFYLHEVELTKKLQQFAFKTGASADESDEPSGANAGAINSILQKIFSVNPDDCKNRSEKYARIRYSAGQLPGAPSHAASPADLQQHQVGETKV